MSDGRVSPSKQSETTNIDMIVRFEAEEEKRVSHINRFSEAIAGFAGTNAFVVTQIGIVVFWVLVNAGALQPIPAFDPFPFPLLSVMLALEAVLLTSFVLIRQNRMSLRADQRSHLDLQINLLAEKEVTKVIQLLQGMSRKMGIEEDITDAETKELSKDTEVEGLARELRENLGQESYLCLPHPISNAPRALINIVHSIFGRAGPKLTLTAQIFDLVICQVLYPDE